MMDSDVGQFLHQFETRPVGSFLDEIELISRMLRQTSYFVSESFLDEIVKSICKRHPSSKENLVHLSKHYHGWKNPGKEVFLPPNMNVFYISNALRNDPSLLVWQVEISKIDIETSTLIFSASSFKDLLKGVVEGDLLNKEALAELWWRVNIQNKFAMVARLDTWDLLGDVILSHATTDKVNSLEKEMEFGWSEDKKGMMLILNVLRAKTRRKDLSQLTNVNSHKPPSTPRF